MFYIGVLLIFIGFSPVSHYVDDIFYVQNQPSYNYNEYYNNDDDYYNDDYDFYDDFFDMEDHHNEHALSVTQTNFSYGYEDTTYTPTGIGSAIFGLILIGFGTYLVVKGWKKPHKAHTFWRIVAIIIILYGLFKVLSDTLVIGNFLYTSIPGRLVVALRYIVPGVLLYFYNRRDVVAEPQQTEVFQPEENTVVNLPNNPIERLVYKLNEAKDTQYARENPQLEQNLESSINILEEIHRSDYNIDDDFLEQIANLTDTYLEITRNKIQNQRSREVLSNIGKTYGVVNEALENIYDSNFDEKANEIESDITSFETKLSLDGKLDSPFEKFKENYQNNDE